MNQNRIKSPVLWGAIAAIALLVLRACGFTEAAALASTRSGEIFELICAALAVLGVINNPTNKGGM